MKKIFFFAFLMVSCVCFAQQVTHDSVYADTTSHIHTCHIFKNCVCASDTTKMVRIKYTDLKGYKLCTYCEYKAKPVDTTPTPSKSSSYSTSSNSTSTYKNTNNHTIYTGPRGGKYYINSKGKKVYVKH